MAAVRVSSQIRALQRANGSGQPPFWADLLVTGLVVGAGHEATARPGLQR
jgi:hypothetical protein